MLRMLQTIYGESTMSKSNAFKQHRHFTVGRADENDDDSKVLS
jgi:hypothetical protein